MKHKTTSALPHYFFECVECGTYPVSKETLRDSITPELRGELNKAVTDGAAGIKLTFAEPMLGCPRCKPNEKNKRTVTLVAMIPTKSH